MHTFSAENYTTKNLHRKWCRPLQQATLINGENSSTTKLNMFFIRFMYLGGNVGEGRYFFLRGLYLGPFAKSRMCYVWAVRAAKSVYTHTLFTMKNEDVCIIIIKIKVHFYMFVKKHYKNKTKPNNFLQMLCQRLWARKKCDIIWLTYICAESHHNDVIYIYVYTV